MYRSGICSTPDILHRRSPLAIDAYCAYQAVTAVPVLVATRYAVQALFH